MSRRQLMQAASLLLSLALLGLAHGDGGFTAPPPDASATADKQLLDFGDVTINFDSAPQTVTFQNWGTETVRVDSFVMQPADAAFRVISTTCVPAVDYPNSATTLATLQSCTVTLVAHPTVTGPATATFNLDLFTTRTSAFLQSTTVHLQVNGLAPPPVIVTADKLMLDFGDVLVNTKSKPQTVTMTNKGTQEVAIRAAAQLADDGFVGAGFTVSGGTYGTFGSIAPGASRTLVIQAIPTVAGSQGASIYLLISQQKQPQVMSQVVHVRANALPLPNTLPLPLPLLASPAPSPSPSPNTAPSTVTVTPALLEFGNVPLGSSSGFKALTFTNTGNKKIHILSVALTSATGYQAAGFSLARTGSSCYVGKRLASGASCTVWVKASPTVKGSNGANVYLTYVDTAGVAGTSQMTLLHASALPAARRALRA